MLRFSDFSHLPEVDRLVRQLIDEPRGLIVVAGPDSRPGETVIEGADLPHFLPSGRATIFRILVSELLDARPRARGVVVAADKDVLHVARRFKSRLEFVQIKPPLTYDQAIDGLAGRHPGLLIVDCLTAGNLPSLLAAARHTLVVTQLDTVYHAGAVARYLRDLGAPAGDLEPLRWVLSVQRLPMLCPICRQAATVSIEQLAQLESLARRYPALAALEVAAGAGAGSPAPVGAYFAPGRCDQCKRTGRQGHVAVFDFLRVEPGASPWEQPSALPMAGYVWMMAQRGQLSLLDALEFESEQLRRTYSLLMRRERQLIETEAALERKTVELDTANRLLNRRTRELVSLEGIGQALITWNDLSELGGHVLRAALELSKADRGVLYYVRSAEWAQVLAAHGWREAEVGVGMARAVVYEGLSEREPLSFVGRPPGVPVAADSPLLRAGLAVPLVAHGIPAGLMLVQSTRKSRFTQGEVAILQTLAGYAAVAMQRAGLVEQLRGKIEALEEAQENLAQKERLESELELARQVQLSMLPRTFPRTPGLTFAASYAPARQVGGDFYDVIRLGGDRVGLVIADVSDKGMPAALYMALSRSLILAAARQFDSPAEALTSVNQLLLELGEQDMFVTVFYGVLDRSGCCLTYARAGHDRPLLLRDGTAQLLGGRGMALGLFEAGLFTVTQESLDLQSGDRLMLYTDGLSDVVNGDGEMLDAERLIELALTHAARPPAEFCRALFDDLAAYQGDAPQFDDMALVVVAVE